ncbi:histidine kinase [Streptomyces sp. NPDC004327]|uniref:sensor histidine kinase n=1 Tax=unclassified Streptomyces TaxID=2593676 RepID=UPI0036986542
MALTSGMRARLARVSERTTFLTVGALLQLTAFWLALAVLPVRPLTSLQQLRFRSMLGVTIPPATTREDAPRGLRDRLTSSVTHRQLSYHLLAGPLVALGTATLLTLWAVGFATLLAPAWIFALPPESKVGRLAAMGVDGYLCVIGLVTLLVVMWLTGVLVRLDVLAATELLGPSRTEQLRRRVEDLSESRAGVLDAADIERRRIERDLHDGAQQRLVSLAVNLGIAKATVTDLPNALKVIAEAHREAKDAITELQDLVRGLHPAVLEDRGLDAALTGLASRVPVPVRLSVAVEPRPTAAVEAVAYYVVSESLTNVVKHARASQVDVRVERRGDLMTLTIADDGAGGADPAGGTGLAGLAKRVTSVDGTFVIDSPVGGPTRVEVELPCAR